MINKIKIYVLVIFILLMVLLLRVDKEYFQSNQNFIRSNREMNGNFQITKVNWRRDGAYTNLGPTCVSTCIAEHVPVINFRHYESPPQGERPNPLGWNKVNPSKGFCYRANNREYPFNCDADCQAKCGNDNNNYGSGNYDPTLDFSNCEVDENLGCVEKNLNWLTGCAVQNSVGCRECLRTYLPNLTALKNVFYEEVIQPAQSCQV